MQLDNRRAIDTDIAPDEDERERPSAVIYLRVSTKEQAKRGGEIEGFSIPAQREACKRKAEVLGAAVVEEFVDRGESAKSADRPELQRLLAYLRDSQVGYVIVHKIDRLARNRVDDVEITLAIRAAGATLVSCSESIDETPSGMLLHGIMSSIAEFYSRNLANEVIKGTTEKAKRGGTNGKAPIGYRNVRRIENNQEIRTVEVDPVRGPLMQWAFETYATGDWSLQRILAELTHRGLVTTPTRNRPSRPLYLSHLHKLLRHPYYKGIVRYRGVEYEGRHEPLVSPHTWQRVQDILAAHHKAGDRPRVHPHYLKGTVFCGKRDENGAVCGSRLMVTHARSRSGRIYPYFVCASRHNKRSDCTFKAVLIDKIEDELIEHYAEHELTPEQHERLQEAFSAELAKFREEAATERERLRRQRHRLLNERAKLLQAHYADAVPLELMRAEQQRITDALAHIDQKLEATQIHHERVDKELEAALTLATDLQATYRSAPDHIRRRINQQIFDNVFVEEDGHLSSVLAQPFDLLLNPDVHRLGAPTARQKRLEAPEPDWSAWETSFNDDGAHRPRNAKPGRQRRRPGLNFLHLVAPGGIEPPHAASKAAALSAELRGRADLA